MLQVGLLTYRKPLCLHKRPRSVHNCYTNSSSACCPCTFRFHATHARPSSGSHHTSQQFLLTQHHPLRSHGLLPFQAV